MQPNQFDHSPPHTTLTHQWMETRKAGIDDEETNQTRLIVEAERKQKRNRDKPFARGTGGGETDAAVWMQSEISELTMTEVLEAEVYESSDDNEFMAKLISPHEKYSLHTSRMEDDVGDIISKK